MNDRTEAAKRVATVRAQMAKLAQWRRFGSEARLAEVEAARQELERFVAEAQPTGRMAGITLSQARKLSERRKTAESLRERDVAALREAERRLKMAEGVADRLASEERDRIARADLEHLVERLAVGASASLP